MSEQQLRILFTPRRYACDASARIAKRLQLGGNNQLGTPVLHSGRKRE